MSPVLHCSSVLKSSLLSSDDHFEGRCLVVEKDSEEVRLYVSFLQSGLFEPQSISISMLSSSSGQSVPPSEESLMLEKGAAVFLSIPGSPLGTLVRKLFDSWIQTVC